VTTTASPKTALQHGAAFVTPGHELEEQMRGIELERQLAEAQGLRFGDLRLLQRDLLSNDPNLVTMSRARRGARRSRGCRDAPCRDDGS
jgi:hypothetical protein